MLRNYFSVLELPIDASVDDIRLAYRRLARRFHPDLNPEDPNAANAFRMVHEAFEYLSSPEKMEKLRRQLEVEVSQIRRKNSKVPALRSDRNRISRVSKVRYKQNRDASDLDLHLTLSVTKQGLHEHQMIEFLYSRPCPKCRTEDQLPKHKLKACKICDGVGFQLIQRGANKWKKSCEACLGRGYVAAHCETCQGRAKISEKQIVEFMVPKNADLKTPICLRGLGNVSFDGSKRGDVWVQLELRK